MQGSARSRPGQVLEEAVEQLVARPGDGVTLLPVEPGQFPEVVADGAEHRRQEALLDELRDQGGERGPVQCQVVGGAGEVLPELLGGGDPGPGSGQVRQQARPQFLGQVDSLAVRRLGGHGGRRFRGPLGRLRLHVVVD